MAQIDGLLAVLDLRGRDARRARRRLGSMRAAWLIVFAITLVAALWTGISALQFGWETGQWGVEYQTRLLTFIIIPVQCLIPWLQVVMRPVFRPTPRQLTGGAAALRDSAALDTRGIPVAADVLLALDDVAPPSLPAALGPFHRPNSALRAVDTVLGIVLLLSGLGIAGIFIAVLVAAPRLLSWPPAVSLSGVALGLVLCTGGVALLVEASRLGRRVRVQADEMGLRWEQDLPRRHEVRVPWADISSIFVISHTRGLDRRLTCVVDGGAATLVFDLSSETFSGEVTDAKRLAKRVLARTGQPLLDQTKLAESLCARRDSSQYRAAYETLTRPRGAGLSPTPWLPRPFTARHIKAAVVIFLLPILLIPGFVLSGAGLRHEQQQQYSALLAEAHAHPPLYHDALARPDADWVVHGPTSDDPSSYSFAGGGYLITPAAGTSQQDSPFIEVYAPGTYREAMVEVTMRMAPGGVPFASAGLALHAVEGDAGANLQFGIAGDGGWAVNHFANCSQSTSGLAYPTCGYYADGPASVIHRAAWAPNKLSVILRGSQVICFINGVYVGSLVDPHPHAGRLGFGVEGLGVAVEFSDFTIYPL